MTNLTKNIGTVTLTGAAEKVTLPASYGWVWVKNMSEGDIFAGVSADISEGTDGVMVIPSGECGRIQADGFSSVYLLGSGNVQIVGQNYADCPFKAGGKGGELPVASTDTLGGVMVDGTSITADEQGVISAVGGGGLELIGEYYAQVPSEFIVISGADLKEGDIYLLSASPNPTSAVQCYNIYTIPPLTTSVSSGYIRCNSSNSGATTQDVYFKISTDGLILYADRLAYQCYVKFYKIKVG